jgi:processive 1,2-diacylglycerol beta-glucosyltransferase
MPQDKKRITIFTTDQGHKSLSDTIAKALQPAYEVNTFSDDNFMFAYYIFIYRFFPWSTKLPFIAFQNPLLRKLSSFFLDIQYRYKVKTFIKKTNPDLIINVFWMFRPSLDILLRDKKIKYLNIVTDPWTVHPFVASTIADDNLAFDETTIKVITKQIDEKVKVTPIGWFVRDAFEADFNKVNVRTKLRIKQNIVTILFTTGSEGTEMVLPIIEKLVKAPQPVQIIVACGNNKSLLEKVMAISSHASSQSPLVAIPFTNELHLYMQAADLVVGKAGPNSVFEAVATLTPFFATTHISGQEDGNLDIIRELQLGYVEEDPQEATKLLLKIIENPLQLEAFSTSLKKLAQYNKQSKEKLRATVTKIL